MDNQELLAKIEEWVDDNTEYYFDEVPGLVEVPSLIAFIKKLLHE